jgi:ceramide glucosyltransferase
MLALSKFTVTDWIVGAWWLGAVGTYVVTLLSPARRPMRAPREALLPISVIVPVRGVDDGFEQNLESFFRLDYPQYELIFCLHDDDDPALPLIRRAIVANPRIPARASIGMIEHHANPKIGNLDGVETLVQHPLVLLSAANVSLAPDTAARLVTMLRPGIGVVSAIAAATRVETFAGELEAAMCNGYFARWLFAAIRFRVPVGLGAAMLMRTSDLVQIGGFASVGHALCDDSEIAHEMRALGLRSVLAPEVAYLPLGARDFDDFWQRHLRWIFCRRCYAAPLFFLEPWLGMLGATIAGTWFWSQVADLPPVGVAAAMIGLWLLFEALYLLWQGWQFSWRAPFAWIVREVLLPPLWFRALFIRRIVWRGRTFELSGAHSANAAE